MESKPGYKTTEFWFAVIASLVGVLGATGAFTPDQVSAVNEGLIELGGAITPVIAAFGYNLSRGNAKTGIKPE